MTETPQRALPRKRAVDFKKTEFAEEIVPIVEVCMAAWRSGANDIRGRRFRDCLVEGPAVLLLAQGVLFGDCDLGDAAGDLRTLLFRPMSDAGVTGAVPLVDCTFERCNFIAIGFTGNEPTLDALYDLTGLPRL